MSSCRWILVSSGSLYAVSQKIHLQTCGGTFDRKTRTTTKAVLIAIAVVLANILRKPNYTKYYFVVFGFLFITQFKQKSFKNDYQTKEEKVCWAKANAFVKTQADYEVVCFISLELDMFSNWTNKKASNMNKTQNEKQQIASRFKQGHMEKN